MTDIIHNPPSWIVAVIIAVLTAHAIDKLIEYVTRRRSHNGLIPILELFIVFVLGFLALHAYYEGMLASEHENGWYNQPFSLVVALVVFALGSMVLYVISRPGRATTSRKRSARPKD